VPLRQAEVGAESGDTYLAGIAVVCGERVGQADKVVAAGGVRRDARSATTERGERFVDPATLVSSIV